jgi:hypothetical protein
LRVIAEARAEKIEPSDVLRGQFVAETEFDLIVDLEVELLDGDVVIEFISV